MVRASFGSLRFFQIINSQTYHYKEIGLKPNEYLKPETQPHSERTLSGGRAVRSRSPIRSPSEDRVAPPTHVQGQGQGQGHIQRQRQKSKSKVAQSLPK